jgi:hypothetical protein
MSSHTQQDEATDVGDDAEDRQGASSSGTNDTPSPDKTRTENHSSQSSSNTETTPHQPVGVDDGNSQNARSRYSDVDRVDDTSDHNSVHTSSDTHASSTHASSTHASSTPDNKIENAKQMVNSTQMVLDSYKALSTDYRANHADTKRLFEYTTSLHHVFAQLGLLLSQTYADGSLVSDDERRQLQEEHLRLMEQVQRMQQEWPTLSNKSLQTHRELEHHQYSDALQGSSFASGAKSDKVGADDSRGESTVEGISTEEPPSAVRDDHSSSSAENDERRLDSSLSSATSPEEVQRAAEERSSSSHEQQYQTSNEERAPPYTPSRPSSASTTTASSSAADPQPARPPKITSVTVVPPVSHSKHIYQSQPRRNRRRLRLVRRTPDGKHQPVQMFEGVPSRTHKR